MIFPNDVHKRIQNQKKITGQNQVQLMVTIFVVGNIVCFFALRWLLITMLGLGLQAVFLVQAILISIVGVFVFRFAVFNELQKKQEHKSLESDSFARFMYLRKDAQQDTIVQNRTIHMFEFINGCATCTLEFRFGSNNDVRAEMTNHLIEQLINAVLGCDFEYRLTVMPEDFRSSCEFREQVRRINKMPDTALRNTCMKIFDDMLEESYRVCNVDVLYLTVRTRTNYQKNELEDLIATMIKILTPSLASFRSVTFLDLEQLLEFYREFYKIAAIDLAMMRAIELSKSIDDDFTNIVKIYALRDETGRTFRNNTDPEAVFRVNERRLNL